MNRRLLLSLCLVCAWGCATVKPKPLVAHPPGEADLEWLPPPPEAKADFDREAGDYGEWQAKSRDGRYTVNQYNYGPDNDHSISFAKETGAPDRIETDLLAGETMICSLDEARIEVGARMDKLLEQVKAKGELRAAAAAGVRAVSGYPLLFADALYLKKLEKGTELRERKLAVFTRPGMAITCEHDGAGLRATFERAVRRLVETLRDSNGSPPPPRRFAELDTKRSGGKITGYQLEEFFQPAADGSYRRELRTVDLYPLPEGKPGFQGSDEVRLEKRTGDGKLVEGAYVVQRGARLTAKVVAQADGSLDLEGDSNGTFTFKLKPSDQLRFHPAAEWLALAAGTAEAFTEESLDLSHPDQVTKMLMRSAKDGHNIVVEIDGKPVARAEVDARGVVVAISTPDGSYVSKQLYTEGTVP